MTRIFLAACLAAGFALPALAEPLVWSQWRGPERDGTLPSGSLPDTLDGLKLQWHKDLGEGYPGPIVTADRVFVVESVDKKVERVRALERRSGDELWAVEWAGTGEVPFFAAANGDWVRATPAFDGETLYVAGMEEVLVALDAETGKERWRVDFPERYSVETPHFGFATSPLVDGDFLYTQAANSVLKLDKRTGETVWRSAGNSGDMMQSGAFSSPVIAEIAGKRQLLAQMRISLYGLDLESGEELWSTKVPNFRGMNILTPTVIGDKIFTSTHRNASYLYEVTQIDGKFFVERLWTNKAKGYMSNPVVVDGDIYMHLGNQRFTCLDAETGESHWTSLPFGKYWSVVTDGQRILALDETGELHLIDANPKSFEKLDTAEVSEQETWGHIAVSGEQLFVRELRGIAAYSLPPGD